MKEREELLRKEQMQAMLLKAEMDKFMNTPGDSVVATSDSFSIPPTVLQIIDDLDNELIGLSSVSISVDSTSNFVY
jgi:peptidyl-tRNA hydrolase